MDFKSILKRHLINTRGWRSGQKIVVLESDDWGTVRTPSRKSLEILQKNGLEVNKCHYTRYDCLESDEDLEMLFGVLKSFKDTHGNHPVITANTLVANPDFEKIKASGYTTYHYELFTDTFKKYPAHSRAYALWKEGMAAKVFYPQLHGREHLNISRWMSDLRQGADETRMCFDLGIFGLSGLVSKMKRGSYLAAFDGGKEDYITDNRMIISEAVKYFKDITGYYSASFIAPNYVWDDSIETLLKENSIRYIQGSRVQQVSSTGGTRERKVHWLGQRNNLGQIYLVRNCMFEPSADPRIDWVNNCLKEIETAFFWRKPAIISTHRVNYMGFIEPGNRNNNLLKLKDLLTGILKKWPDAMFTTSDQLGNLIKYGQQ